MITKLIFSGNNLTLTFDTGELYMGSCNLEQAKHLSQNESLTLEEVRAYLEPDFTKVLEENKKSKQLVETVLTDDRFYYAEGSLYRVGIPLSIPKHLAEDIATALEMIQDANSNLDDVNGAYWSDELERLDNFWKWTSLIRTPESRESFYTYCQKNTLLITKQGFVVAFRRANHVGRDNSFVKFVTQEYLRLRNNKKSTAVPVYKNNGSNEYTLKNYTSGFDDSGLFTYIGILKDLYHSLSENEEEHFESVTTSNYTGLPAIYRIGKETRLPENEVDWNPKNDCSPGLHTADKSYGFNGFGDTPVAVILNPMDVASCNGAKIRSQALTFLTVLNKDCEFELTSEIEEMIDEMFANHTNNLQQMLETGNFQEFSKHKLVKELHFTSILNTIVSENKEVVKQRYTKL